MDVIGCSFEFKIIHDSTFNTLQVINLFHLICLDLNRLDKFNLAKIYMDIHEIDSFVEESDW